MKMGKQINYWNEFSKNYYIFSELIINIILYFLKKQKKILELFYFIKIIIINSFSENNIGIIFSK
jgi:hypothetical protein